MRILKLLIEKVSSFINFKYGFKEGIFGAQDR